MTAKSAKSAKELVTTNPEVFERRRQLILALCPTGPRFYSAEDVAEWIVATANKIIEKTEQ